MIMDFSTNIMYMYNLKIALLKITQVKCSIKCFLKRKKTLFTYGNDEVWNDE